MDGDDVTSDRALVERITKQVCREFGVYSLEADIRQSGHVGALEARSRFDPSKAIPFEGFAYRRIRGAMLDMLRKSGRLGRYALERCERAAKLEALLEQATEDAAGKPPTGAVDAAHQIGALLSRSTVSYVADMAASVERHGTEEGIVTQVDAGKVREAVLDLPDYEAGLIFDYFWEGKTLADIAAAAGGRSESWACRELGKALDLLREMLR